MNRGRFWAVNCLNALPENCRGALAHAIGRQRGQHTRFAIDAVRRQAARRRAGGEQEIPGRVETEGARNRFGRYVSDRRQMTGGGVHGEPGDAVMAAIADV